ncbi:hypothetical protein M5D96_011607 [Drosophila gunungcola]|uniref:Uncharacterized protein n=1 Tax=Drosophila gunungcola TaxID=103775 RepID=A0A9P9YFD3_9MUSC|nr:hypothetical protein M5D96_011607 [Drosophila gunungcola]
MLRSDLMLESGCPELSPRALRQAAGEDRDQDAVAVGKGGAGTAAAAAGRKQMELEMEMELELEMEKEEQAERMERMEEHGAIQLCRATKEREHRAAGIQSAYCCWKQVEINTIASGFGHLGPASKTIQRCCPQPQPHTHTHTHSPSMQLLQHTPPSATLAKYPVLL